MNRKSIAGSRMLRDLLSREGIAVSRTHVAHADEAHWHRCDLPQAQLQPTSPGAPYLDIIVTGAFKAFA